MNSKHYVILETMPDGEIYAGINDYSYYGNGQIISQHDTEQEAVQVCEQYAKEHNIKLFAEYKYNF
jgi:hypothetical protein